MLGLRITSVLLSLTLILAAPLAAQTVPPPADAGPIVGFYTTEGIGEGTEVSVELADLPVLLNLFLEPYTGFSAMEFAGPELDAVWVMLPNSEGLDSANPVFHVRAGTVAVEPASLSSVKSLFR